MARDPRILYGDCDISFRDWALLEIDIAVIEARELA